MRISKNTALSNQVRRLSSNIVVEKGATLTIENSMLYLYGRTFKVYGNLVIKDSTIKMPWVDLAYGFGGDLVGEETTNGNITIEDSFIDVPCFYAFFNRESTVLLKNSIFAGFGRIAGADSEAYNCTFLDAHDRYGSIATYGQVKGINYCTSIGSTSLYYNPALSQDCVIENMLITGQKMAYLEPTASYTLTLVDCDILHRDVIDNGFTGKIEIAHRIEVSGILKRDDGVEYTGDSVVPQSVYENGTWRDYAYTINDRPIPITGNNKFINPSSALFDGDVEGNDLAEDNHIVDLVPLDVGLVSTNCPYCESRLFFPTAQAINERYYHNRCKECKDYSLQDVADSMMYGLKGEARSKGLINGNK